MQAEESHLDPRPAPRMRGPPGHGPRGRWGDRVRRRAPARHR